MGKIKRMFGIGIAILCSVIVAAAEKGDITFNKYFEDATLRLDCEFAGNNSEQHAYLSKLCRQDTWAGRRQRLNELLLEGNGQVEMRDHVTGELIYVNSFSSLFTEWLVTEEARHVNKSFQQCFNVPFPKQKADIHVMLRNNYRKVIAEMEFMVDPSDILIRKIGNNGVPYSYIMKNGDCSQCIDLAIVAEGYTADEMEKFRKDAHRAADLIFGHAPFDELKERFNVVAVETASAESGVSIPGNKVWKNTALGSHFDTFYMDRYLTHTEDIRMNDLLSGIPFEHIIIIVNTEKYGGGGIFNQWTIAASDHPTFPQVLVHEFGHAYAGLADEYEYGDNPEPTYPDGIEPWEPNITTKANFAAKWQDMLSTPGVGLYEGGGYRKIGVWRPVDSCRMKVNNVKDFCPVCTRAIKRITDFYTSERQ